MTSKQDPWGHDCWGRLNEVTDISAVVATLSGLPEAFREARRAMLRQLALEPASRLLEAGCGPGTALPDVLEFIGEQGRITGVDPTGSLITIARQRARELGVPHVSYSLGDIRDLKFADESFDAAFCDKILLHVGPVSQAVAEMVRVVRRGGRVGAVEWYSQGMIISAADYALTRRVMDGTAQVATYNPNVALELEQLLAEAGLQSVTAASKLAESHQLTPSLRTILARRAQQAIELGAVEQRAAEGWLRELEERAASGRFYWAALVRYAVGIKAVGSGQRAVGSGQLKPFAAYWHR
jgi:ubiquinone/menaquinone biosynthesis C-methylase UbiE